MKTTYYPHGTCSKQIDVEVEDRVIKSVKFYGGCPGNTLGVSTLVQGMDAGEAITKLKGIRCGSKSTSCPDQLSKALEKAISEQN